MRKLYLPVVAACLAFAGSEKSLAASPQEIAAAKCDGCHGAGSNGPSGGAPRLNAQNADYIFRRVRSFKNLTQQSPRATKYMWQVSSSLSNSTLHALANYFAALPATAPASSGEGAERGRTLYQKGVGQQVPGCQNCHGSHGEGVGSAPRLAGQHADYLRQQIGNFATQMRIHGPMNQKAGAITPAQIDDLVAYLAKD